MHIFKPGSQFLLRGRRETVDYVMLKRDGLLVYLVGVPVPCRPGDLAALPASQPPQAARPTSAQAANG